MNTFDGVSSALAEALGGSLRRDIVADAADAADLRSALMRLRSGMRSNIWKVSARTLDLERTIQKYDRKTRHVGFHVLHDWDGIADRVNDDTIPVDVLHYLAERRGEQPVSSTALAILLDYYFMHVLALLTLRIWDEGDADHNLHTVEQLLALLQGEQGSGQHFSADAETLLLIGTSHYELHERGYGVLLDKTRTLSRRHQVRIALGHAASMGCHLRFGFEATYGRDTVNMRDDNTADYPWLCYALATLIDEYVRVQQGHAPEVGVDRVIEALLNGLSADARAFLGPPPPMLSSAHAERQGFRDTFFSWRADLLPAFETYRPTSETYSPLCFFFNFSHNVVKGFVIDALLQDRPRTVTHNALLTALPVDPVESAVKREVADTLMGYARANPHRIRGRLKPVIVYDVQSGREAYSVAMRKMKE